MLTLTKDIIKIPFTAREGGYVRGDQMMDAEAVNQ